LDEESLKGFMRREHQSEIALKRCISAVQQWEEYLQRNQTSQTKATRRELRAFADFLGDGQRIKPIMHGLLHYFKFLGDAAMSQEAGRIRSRYLKRNVLRLKEFVGVPQDDVVKLRERGIINADNILEAGATESQRRELAKATGISYGSILSLAKMADLSRIFGVKGIRARLYVDSGNDSVEKMSLMSPDNLIAVTRRFIDRTGFSGIPPTPKEAQSTIEAAKSLPKIVDC
jgi:hypothetical protein